IWANSASFRRDKSTPEISAPTAGVTGLIVRGMVDLSSGTKLSQNRRRATQFCSNHAEENKASLSLYHNAALKLPSCRSKVNDEKPSNGRLRRHAARALRRRTSRSRPGALRASARARLPAVLHHAGQADAQAAG